MGPSKVAVGVAAAAMVLVSSQVAFALTLDANNGSFNFGADDGSRQTEKIGELAAEGFTHRYEDVITIGGTSVDAIATLVDVTNIDSDDDSSDGADNLLDEFDDDSSSGEEIDFDIDILDGASSGSATIRVAFVEDGGTSPVTLQNLSLFISDVDDDQFVRFAGISAYELSANPATALSISDSDGVYTFTEPDGDRGSSPDEEFWVVVEYSEASFVEITLGANTSGSAGFGIQFTDPTWTNAATRQNIALTAYDVTYDANNADSGTAPSTQSSTTSSATVSITGTQGSLVRSGFDFAGWNTDPDGEGVNFVAGDTVTLTADLPLYAQWEPAVESSSPANSSTPPNPASAPAIHLDLMSSPGLGISETPVLYEGEGLSRGTPYTLRLLSGELLASGEVDRYGYFSDTAVLPALAPGSYSVVLETRSPAGQQLTLTQAFSVGPNGLVNSVGEALPVSGSDVLAVTGPSSPELNVALAGVTVLSILGAALLIAGYSRQVTPSALARRGTRSRR